MFKFGTIVVDLHVKDSSMLETVKEVIKYAKESKGNKTMDDLLKEFGYPKSSFTERSDSNWIGVLVEILTPKGCESLKEELFDIACRVFIVDKSFRDEDNHVVFICEYECNYSIVERFFCKFNLIPGVETTIRKV